GPSSVADPDRPSLRGASLPFPQPSVAAPHRHTARNNAVTRMIVPPKREDESKGQWRASRRKPDVEGRYTSGLGRDARLYLSSVGSSRIAFWRSASARVFWPSLSRTVLRLK